MTKKSKPLTNPGIGEKFLQVYRDAFGALKHNPTIVLLFLIIGVLDALALTALFLSHSKPFSYILAPLVRTFYSDAFLHYPANFLLLPKIFTYAHILILTVFGIFITGIVIKKIEAHQEGRKLGTAAAVQPVLKKYLGLMVIWLATYFAFSFILKWTLPLFPNSFIVQVGLTFLLGVAIQSLFVLIIPSILLSGSNYFQAIGSGLRLGATNFPVLSLLIALPIFFLIGFSVLKALAPVFVQIYPEAVLWILAAGILVSVAADLFITSTATILYLQKKGVTQ